MPKPRAVPPSPPTPAPLAIEHVDPSSLTPAPYNPRTMTEDARQRLVRGIQEFGLVDPLVARRSDRLVVGGHQRLAAALTLGLSTVPVVFLDDIDDQRAAALNVLLNNPKAQGEWDMPMLATLLSDLDGHGFNATLTGFSGEDLLTFLAPDMGKDVAFKAYDEHIDTEHQCPKCGYAWSGSSAADPLPPDA